MVMPGTSVMRHQNITKLGSSMCAIWPWGMPLWRTTPVAMRRGPSCGNAPFGHENPFHYDRTRKERTGTDRLEKSIGNATAGYQKDFAYLVGSKIGRHKLAPRTSPKKSWEGFIAGLVGSQNTYHTKRASRRAKLTSIAPTRPAMYTLKG